MSIKIPWQKPQPGRFTLTEWEIDPARTALFVLDMQRGYVDPDLGIGPILEQRDPTIHGYYYPRLAEVVLGNVLRLQRACRKWKMEVIYTRRGLQLPTGRDVPPWNWRRRLGHGPGSGLLERGSEEYDIEPELVPTSRELVLDRHSASPFTSMELNQVLHNMAVENLVLAGVLTDVAVEATAKDGVDLGYNTIVAEDACAAYRQEQHEDTFARAHSWVSKTTDEIIGFLTPSLE